MFDPVTIILVLLLVLVTILYFTKKPKDQFKLSPNFKEVSLPLSSPDGKLKLETKESIEDNIKFIASGFTYENQEKGPVESIYIGSPTNPLLVYTSDGKELFNSPITNFLNSYNITNGLTFKLYESYDSNIYRLINVLNDKFIISMSYSILSTTMPKLSLTDDKKFVISNITYPGVPNEAKLDINGI